MCEDCYYFNAYHLTYIEKKFDCCAYFHTAYFKEENYGKRRKSKSCKGFKSKYNIQLTLNF